MTATIGSVGLIMGNIRNPFFTELAEGVDEITWAAQRLTLLAGCADDPLRQREAAAEMLARGVEGLIITVPHDPEVLAINEVPIIAIDRCGGGVPYVSVDNVQGGRLATAHLIRRGYTRIGVVYAAPELSSVADRLAGYRMALHDHEHPLDAALMVNAGALSFEAAATGARQLLDEGADAVFAINDLMASGVVVAVHQAGRRIPEDVGVVGYDDTPMAAWPALQLTSIAQGTVEIGRTAARLLLQRIGAPQVTVHPVVLTPDLVQRQSSRRPAAPALV